MPGLTGKETTAEILKKVEGSIIHLKAYCYDDWISDIKTIPFQVQMFVENNDLD